MGQKRVESELHSKSTSGLDSQGKEKEKQSPGMLQPLPLARDRNRIEQLEESTPVSVKSHSQEEWR